MIKGSKGAEQYFTGPSKYKNCKSRVKSNLCVCFGVRNEIKTGRHSLTSASQKLKLQWKTVTELRNTLDDPEEIKMVNYVMPS